MLPPFDDVGNLPPGIHSCSVPELITRLGSGSEEREAEISELVQFIEAARTAGVRRLLVNGSFVTGKLAPNDVDVVFLPGPDYPREGPKLDDEELEAFGAHRVKHHADDQRTWMRFAICFTKGKCTMASLSARSMRRERESFRFSS